MRNLFRKPKPTPAPIHPDINTHEIELAWEADGEKFYRMKDMGHLMTKGRGVFVNAYIKTLQNYRVTPEAFQNWKEAMRNALNVQDGQINIGLAHKLLDQLEEREAMFTDLEAAYKVCALSTFTLTDDLAGGLDPEEEARRISLLKKKTLEEFLQIRPLTDFGLINLPSKGTSRTHFNSVLKGNQAIVNAQNLFWMRVNG